MRVQGGEEHDAGHILFQRRPQDDSLRGSGKLGAGKVVASLSKDAIAGIQQLCSDGLEHELRPILEPFKVAVPLFFTWNRWTKIVFNLTQVQRTLFLPQRPRNRDAGQICQGKVCRRLSRWSGKWCFKLPATAGTTPQVNFKAVGLQCTELPGTRALASCFRTNILMWKGLPNMWFWEIQQRSDERVFWKHYYHAEEEQVEAALEHGAAPSMFTKGLPEALPTEAAVPIRIGAQGVLSFTWRRPATFSKMQALGCSLIIHCKPYKGTTPLWSRPPRFRPNALKDGQG